MKMKGEKIMIRYSLEDHIFGFPTKLLAAEGGKHIYNIKLTKDMDNCTLVGRGTWLGLDLYQQAAVPTTGSGNSEAPDFAGIIREKAANGNWYVEVTADTDALWIYDAVVIPEDYNLEFQKESRFFNEKGKTVKAYGLCKGDIFEVSESAFDGTPAADTPVTYNATKNQYVI